MVLDEQCTSELRVSADARNYICRPLAKDYSFPQVDDTIEGRYRIISADSQSPSGDAEHIFLGAGGGGRVYLAEDVKAGNRTVAIKFYQNSRDKNCSSPLAQDVRSRFEHEGVLLEKYGSNSDSGIRQLPEFYSRGMYGAVKRPYIVMERLYSIDADIQESLPRDFDTVRRVILKISHAVKLLMAKKITPLDLKLANVMKRADGEIVLIDLGLVEDDSEWARDENGKKYQYLMSLNGLGTDGYIPPYRTISVATVIWALGSIIDSCFFNSPLPLEWHRIVTKCHRLNQSLCYKSIEDFERSVKAAKLAVRTIARQITKSDYLDKFWRIAEADREEKTVEVPWAEAVMSRDEKSSLSRQRSSQRRIEERSLSLSDKPLDFSCHRQVEVVVRNDASTADIRPQTQGKGWIKDSQGRIVVRGCSDSAIVIDFGNPFKPHTFFIKEPIVVETPVTLMFCGNCTINVDLTSVSGTKVIVSKGTSLINRNCSRELDLSEYHLNSLSYLNLLSNCNAETCKYQNKVYHSLFGPSFVRINGPETFGKLIRQQSDEILNARGGVPFPWSIAETTLRCSPVI